MAVLLGGRAAEHVVFAEISTGAADDLQKVANIARSMVTRFGMAESLGQVAYESDQGQFLPAPGGAVARPREFSEATAREIDAAVKGIRRPRVREGGSESSRTRRAMLERGAQLLLRRKPDRGRSQGAEAGTRGRLSRAPWASASRGSLATRLAGPRCEGDTPGSHSPDKGESPPRRQFSVQRSDLDRPDPVVDRAQHRQRRERRGLGVVVEGFVLDLHAEPAEGALGLDDVDVARRLEDRR